MENTLFGILSWKENVENHKEIQVEFIKNDMYDNKFELSACNIFTDCQVLSFDICTAYPCLINNLQVKTDKGLCNAYPINGFEISELGQFFSEAPRYETSNLNGAKNIFLSFTLETVNEKEAKLLSAVQKSNLNDTLTLQNEYEWYLQKLSDTEQKLEELKIEIKNIKTSLLWIITKPIRLLLDLLKKVPPTSLVYKTLRYIKNFGLKQTLTKIKDVITRKKEPLFNDVPKFKSIKEMLKSAYKSGYKIYRPSQFNIGKNGCCKKILLICAATDSPNISESIQCMSEAVFEQKALPIVILKEDDKFCGTLRERGVLSIVDPTLCNDGFVSRCTDLFDLIAANSIDAAHLIEELGNTSVPVSWFVNESPESYTEAAVAAMPRILQSNIHVYCAGELAEKALKKIRPYYNITNILTEISTDGSDIEESDKKRILSAAYTQTVKSLINDLVKKSNEKKESGRKNLHVFLSAYHSSASKSDRVFRENFIKQYDFDPQKKKILLIVEDFSLTDRSAILQHLIESLIRSDSQPVVISAADGPFSEWLASKNIPTIIYQNLYHNDFIQKNAEAYDLIISNELPPFNNLQRILCESNVPIMCLAQASVQPLKLTSFNFGKMPKNARIVCVDDQIHTELINCCPNSSELISAVLHCTDKLGDTDQVSFDQKIQNICVELYSLYSKEFTDTSVSVIIPTYNAGTDALKQLKKLQSQKGINTIEIIAVDSGSSDGTPQVFRDHGARVIEIPQSEFSHSYARNLGAFLATGKTLIFMTQDAVPQDEYWMLSLISPIVCGEAVAVSCIEQCPEDTDLYYKLTSRIHNRFVGIEKSDRITRFEPNDDPDDLRSKAALNDVSAAIDKETFLKFLYRLDYAEDLDMGLRLIKNGYSIKFLQSTSTIHGHNRAPGYYIKRAYMNGQTAGKICDRWKIDSSTQEKIARIVVYNGGILAHGLKLFSQKDSSQYNVEIFINQLIASIKMASKLGPISSAELSDDPVYRWCIEQLLPYSNTPCDDDLIMFEIMLQYIEIHAFKPFLSHYIKGILSQKEKAELLNCIITQFCLMIGHEMAKITPDMPLYDSVKTLGKGV